MPKKNELPKAERWLTWKVPTVADGPGKNELRLLTPRSDPYEHEYPMDLLFETEQEALEALDLYDAQEEATEEGWVLCELHLKPLRKAP